MKLKTPKSTIVIIAIIKEDFIALQDVTLDLFFCFVFHNSSVSNYLNISNFAIPHLYTFTYTATSIAILRSLDVIFFKKSHLTFSRLNISLFRDCTTYESVI